MNTVYLSLGSNLGDRFQYIRKAILLLKQQAGNISKVSSFYESEPLGFSSTNRFINVCIELHTVLSGRELLDKTQDIEKEIGRKEKSIGTNYQSRIIDIDIIFYDQECIQRVDLIVPHPLYRERNFVLIPLAEIAPAFNDPTSQESISSILHQSPDSSTLEKIDYEFI